MTVQRGEELSLTRLRDAIVARRISAEEATRAALHRARSVQPAINAFTEILDERAAQQAREVDRRLDAHEHFGAGLPPSVAAAGGLAGVPVVIKDNMCLAWGKTTCGSRILENYASPFTATAVQRLIDAGAVIIAKANLDEFAMGSSTEHSTFGPTRNPWDLSRVPGGSSGGSAAAVAAGVVTGSLGSDTGGSIRQPAGMCNLVGFKPTYGRVSRYGLVAYASSLDQIGPFAFSVEDAALLATVICGHDPSDSTSTDLPAPDLIAELHQPVNRLVVGVPRQARSSANHTSVSAALDSAAAALRAQGAVVVDVDLPNADYGIAAYYLIATAEASSNLARFDGIRYGRRAALKPGDDLRELYQRSRSEGFGAEVQRRIMLGTHALSAGYYDAYYNTALKVRRLIRDDFRRVFEGGSHVPGGQGCHAVLMPVSPAPAWVIGAKAADPLAEYLEDVYTVGVNLAGLPAVTVPGGFATVDGRDLPVGVQLIGPAMEDALLLRIARMLEQSTGHGARRPKF